MKKLTARPEFAIALLTIAVFCIFAAVTPQFFTPDNIKLFLSQSTNVAIIGIGMTMVVLLGGIDLSAGSVLGLSATCIAMLITAGAPVGLCILCGLAVGIACGFCNGMVITRLRIPDIIATLGTMFVFRGISVAVSGGSWLTNFPEEFSFWGKGELFGLPFSFLLAIILMVAFAFLLTQTTFGRKLYASGGNVEAAKLSGIHVKRIKVIVYTISGCLSALTATIYASKVGSVQSSTAGSTLSNDVLAAVLIGGTSIYGGTGSVVGTMIGAVFLGMVKNALVLTKGISEYWIDAFTGILIIVAVLINTYQSYRKESLQERRML